MTMTLGTLAILMLLGKPAVAADQRTLFAFDGADAAQQWQAVNDGVMGGRSDGRFTITDAGSLRFSGNLSLANNGGFASVRSRPSRLGLKAGESLTLRVKGDGREYSCNLYVPRRLVAFSYRATFQTVKDQWIEVTLPLKDFQATSFGRIVPNQPLNAGEVTGLGILLGDKKPGPFQLDVAWIKTGPAEGDVFRVSAEGSYPHHLQGVCTDGKAIYWSFTTVLIKTDMSGKLLRKVPVANHHGDLCFHDGLLYVAVNLGKFNDPAGNADSWVYVYDAESLEETGRHATQEVFHGAGGIGFRNDHFFVVGGLPEGVNENFVYEYDRDFKFLEKHVIASGHTHLGIQTATYAHDRWWFGCYGSPAILLVTDSDFKLLGRHELNCSLGIEGLPGGRLLVADGNCDKQQGCTGRIQVAFPDKQTGFRLPADRSGGGSQD